MASLRDYLGERRDLLAARLVEALALELGSAAGSGERVSLFLEDLATSLSTTARRGAWQAQAGCDDGSSGEDATEAATTFAALHVLLLKDAAKHDVRVTLLDHALLASRVCGAVDGLGGRARLEQHEIDHLVHQIRNPLGSASMALTLLRAKVDLGDGARLAELLERNLKRVEDLLGRLVDGASAGGASAAATVGEEGGERSRKEGV